MSRDIVSLYSYFFVNCTQNLYFDLSQISQDEANTFSDRILLLIGNIIESRSFFMWTIHPQFCFSAEIYAIL